MTGGARSTRRRRTFRSRYPRGARRRGVPGSKRRPTLPGERTLHRRFKITFPLKVRVSITALPVTDDSRDLAPPSLLLGDAHLELGLDLAAVGARFELEADVSIQPQLRRFPSGCETRNSLKGGSPLRRESRRWCCRELGLVTNHVLNRDVATDARDVELVGLDVLESD